MMILIFLRDEYPTSQKACYILCNYPNHHEHLHAKQDLQHECSTCNDKTNLGNKTQKSTFKAGQVEVRTHKETLRFDSHSRKHKQYQLPRHRHHIVDIHELTGPILRTRDTCKTNKTKISFVGLSF